MRKTKITRRERDICNRLRHAREYLGVTQLACARRIGIERSTLTNYEAGITPLKHEVALRFCRQLIISEEWLATGKAEAMKAAGLRRGFNPGTDWSSLDSIFVRQCMDLLAEPICQSIPPGTLFSEAYDNFLAKKYAELAQEFFYAPRIVFSEQDSPELGASLVSAYLERWLKLLSNEALRTDKNQWEIQRQFIRAIIEADAHIFRSFIGVKTSTGESDNLQWLRRSLANTNVRLGPLHFPKQDEQRTRESEIAVFEN